MKSREFSTEESGTFDMSQLVARQGSMVAPLRSPDYFTGFFLERGALAWPNGFDLSASAIHRLPRVKGRVKDRPS